VLGFWRETCTYSAMPYGVKALLQDPSPRVNWVPEPYTSTFVNYNNEVKIIRGTFRHLQYRRICVTDSSFTDLTCSNCQRIPQEGDFRMRVTQEDHSIEKRGTHSTANRRKLGYLSVFELAKHSRLIQKKYRVERAYHGHTRHRVAQL
jgi:hypothetical protein